LVASWETRLKQPGPEQLAFLVPPIVADLLSVDAVCDQVSVQFLSSGRDVVAKLTDHLGNYGISWRSDLASFPAPDAFAQVLSAPKSLLQVPYLAFSDAAHQAVAKLVCIEAGEEVNPTKLAILIDLDFGRLSVDGEEIVSSGSQKYYFDPRLVIRALEFLRSPTLGIGITPLAQGNQAFLSLLAREDGWTVHCSLLSIHRDTQRLYPVPPGRNQ
jgi:hypothetical protein